MSKVVQLAQVHWPGHRSIVPGPAAGSGPLVRVLPAV